MINNFEELKEAVKDRLDVTSILREMTHVDVRGNGICPFHADRRKGNFKVYEQSDRFHCFACGASGDALYLMQVRKGADFITTVYELGYEMGLICEDEMNNKRIMPDTRKTKGTQSKTTITFKNEIPIREVKLRKENKELSKAEINLYDICYRVLGGYCGLNDEDKAHLLNDRKINPSKLSDYFSLRDLNNKNVVVNTVKKLKSMGITEKQIVSVPGFAYTKDKRICISTHIRGLALKVRNYEGKVIGIQIRTQLEDKKYIWLSSSNKGGNGSSTPVAIEYPEMVVKDYKLDVEASIRKAGNSILITEGKFKAEALSNKYRCIAFGIAGINNWKNKLKQDYINITYRKDIENIVLFADADCCYNPFIFMQFKEMVQNEFKGTIQNVYVAYWNINYGKGIDDVIHAGYDEKVKYLKLNEYSKLFLEFLDSINDYNIQDVNFNREIKTQTYNKIFNL